MVNFQLSLHNIEKLNTVAKPKKLALLNQNGESYYLKIKNLVDDLKKDNNFKIKTHIEQKQQDLINYKWLLFLLIFPFVEWILRKK